MGLTAPTLSLEVLPFDHGAVGPRYLVIHLPVWRLERCGWQADALAVLVAEQQNATRVVAATPAARAEGIRPGMVVAEARARVAGLITEVLDEVGEHQDRAQLVAAFTRFGERVAPWADDALMIEVSTVRGYFGSEEILLERVGERVVELGHQGRLVLADHPLAAHALAMWSEGGDRIVPTGEGAQALAPLPFAALAPSEGLEAAVRTLGLRTVGAWARLDPASVTGRFGEEGLALHRVARGAAGPSWASLPRPGPVERLRVSIDDELVRVEGVLVYVEQGLERLREQLRARDEVVSQLELRLELGWGPSCRVQVKVARPTRDPAILHRLLADRLSRIRIEAPVTGLLLHAAQVTPDGGGQQDLLDRREQAGAWSELVARLGDVLGEQALCTAALRPAWAPEEAWCRVALGQPAPRAEPEIDDPVERQEGQAWHAARPRPTWLRSPPLPLRVHEEEGRPVALRSRRGWHRMGRVRGPERLEGAWWQPNGGFDRDYWVVELGEEVVWLFRGGGLWYLHGWFD